MPVNQQIVAWPRLTEMDAGLLESFRRVHDVENAGAIAAHWTLVFPVPLKEVRQGALSAHMHTVAARHAPVSFHCRHMLVFNNAASPLYHLFLVPDEGFSALCRLHDDLYTGCLRPHLRLDIPFVPHVTVATSGDAAALKDLADAWNAGGRVISGQITHLTRVRDHGLWTEPVESVALGGGGG